MLSSIHPLGERARSNSWVVTVSAFAVGAALGGAALGLLSAGAGIVTRLAETPPIVPALILAAAAAAEIVAIPVPTHHRQVNERWIGTYRGWVYGFGFGAQLGIGFATYVVTWAVPALMLFLAWSGDAVMGALVGMVFGLGRTALLVAARWIDRPDRLSAFHRRSARLARPAHVTGGFVLVALALAQAVSA